MPALPPADVARAYGERVEHISFALKPTNCAIVTQTEPSKLVYTLEASLL